MARAISPGKCAFCGGTFAKGVMGRHLQSCHLRKAVLDGLWERRKGEIVRFFHILVEGRDLPQYWMHLEAPTTLSLEHLDRLLRDIWLECCGHLSAFTIHGTTYSSAPDSWFDQKGLRYPLGRVLSLGTRFFYEYDFGSTTELALRVVAVRDGVLADRSIQLMARNDPPEIQCVTCQKAATRVCTQCINWDEGWCCSDCAAAHECGDEMLLPVVNSPRVGVCGYTG